MHCILWWHYYGIAMMVLLSNGYCYPLGTSLLHWIFHWIYSIDSPPDSQTVSAGRVQSEQMRSRFHMQIAHRFHCLIQRKMYLNWLTSNRDPRLIVQHGDDLIQITRLQLSRPSKVSIRKIADSMLSENSTHFEGASSRRLLLESLHLPSARHF